MDIEVFILELCAGSRYKSIALNPKTGFYLALRLCQSGCMNCIDPVTKIEVMEEFAGSCFGTMFEYDVNLPLDEIKILGGELK